MDASAPLSSYLLERCQAVDVGAVPPRGEAGARLVDVAVVGRSRTAEAGPLRLRPRISEQAEAALRALRRLDENDFIVGHNVEAYDLPLLLEASGEAQTRPLIDSLRLSPLAFPQRSSHARPKTGATRICDPVRDAEFSLELLQKEIAAFQAMDPRWLQALHWLTTLRKASEGYDAVFTEARNGATRPREIWEIEETLHGLRELFSRALCREGLAEVLSEALRKADGWPAAFALSWILHRELREAPAQWTLEAEPTLGATIDRLRDSRCAARCFHCRNLGDAAAAAAAWFPPPEGADFAFQGPKDAEGRFFQERLISAALEKRPCLGILPTGAGKSLCFQVPALERHARTGDLSVVVSPLKALQNDQVRKAGVQGLSSVARLHGDLSVLERQEIAEAIRDGGIALLYVAPERLALEDFKTLLGARRIGAWIFDEAHCIVEWGDGFRGDYHRVLGWIRGCGASGGETAPVFCFTATAPPVVRMEIARLVKEKAGSDLEVFDGGSARPNLGYEVRKAKADPDAIAELVLERGVEEGAPSRVVVYAPTRETCEDLAQALAMRLEGSGHAPAAYHAGLDAERRREVEKDFAEGRIRLVVATIAFGMGVDAPEVRLVVHAGISSSLMAYAQESGRAGRDGKPASCVLFHDAEEVDKRFRLACRSHIRKEEIDALLNVFISMATVGARPDKEARTEEARKRADQEARRKARIAQKDRLFAAPYEVLIRDLYGKTLWALPEPERRALTGRIDRIVDALERAEILGKRPPALATSGWRLRPEAAAVRREELPPLARGLLDLCESRGGAFLDEAGEPMGLDDLAEALGLEGPEGERETLGALRRLRRHGALDQISDLEIRLTPSAGGLKTQIETETALLAVLRRKLEGAAREAPQAAEGEAALPLRTNLKELSSALRNDEAFSGGVTPKMVRNALQAMRRRKLLRVGCKHMRLTSRLEISPPGSWKAAEADQALWHERLRSLWSLLAELAGSSEFVEISSSELVKRAQAQNAALWAEAEGAVADERPPEDLLRIALRWMLEAGEIQIGPGFFAPNDEIRIAFANLPETRSDSFKKGMFEKGEKFRFGPTALSGAAPNAKTSSGVDEIQKEQLRQLHLMDGYARLLSIAPERAPELFKTYFSSTTEEAREIFFPDEEERALVEKNRPASVEAQQALLKRLDSEQRKIVEAGVELKDRLILAGPGAGKTRVLVERVIWLIDVEREAPEGVLALCYNRMAAEEIRARLRERLGARAAAVSVHTYHAFALRILGESLAESTHKAAAEVGALEPRTTGAEIETDAFNEALRRATQVLERHREAICPIFFCKASAGSSSTNIRTSPPPLSAFCARSPSRRRSAAVWRRTRSVS